MLILWGFSRYFSYLKYLLIRILIYQIDDMDIEGLLPWSMDNLRFLNVGLVGFMRGLRKKHGHPNKVIFARLLEKDATCSIYFNYDLKSKIFTNQDYIDYPKLKENIFSTEELII